MGRENKNAAVAALHREQILNAAEKLFAEKGYSQTTIEDLSKTSGYSRRTIYAYFDNKNDILNHIVEKGLEQLKRDFQHAMDQNMDFVRTYKALCHAIGRFQMEYPYSSEKVNKVRSKDLRLENLSETVRHVLLLGTEINDLFAAFIERGKENGVVRQDIIPMPTVYILWSGIQALFTLVQTKGDFLSEQFSVSESEFLEYGFNQLINSILEERL